MNTIAQIMKALSDETRLRIINILKNDELCVCEIIEKLEITQTKASRHLAYLKNTDLVIDRKEKQKIFYKLNEKQKITKEIIKYLDEEIYLNDLKKEVTPCKK